MHAIEAAFFCRAAIASSDIAEFFSSGSPGACDEFELALLESKDAIPLLIFNTVEGAR